MFNPNIKFQQVILSIGFIYLALVACLFLSNITSQAQNSAGTPPRKDSTAGTSVSFSIGDLDGDGLDDSWVSRYCQLDAECTLKSDKDSDNDGLLDKLEFDYRTNPLDPDSDDDGLGDLDEIEISQTDPVVSDSTTRRWMAPESIIKNKNMLDGDKDFDQDGLSNSFEVKWSIEKNKKLDLFNADTDGDGLRDGEEILIQSSPISADTDNDGVLDSLFASNNGTKSPIYETKGMTGTNPLHSNDLSSVEQNPLFEGASNVFEIDLGGIEDLDLDLSRAGVVYDFESRAINIMVLNDILNDIQTTSTEIEVINDSTGGYSFKSKMEHSDKFCPQGICRLVITSNDYLLILSDALNSEGEFEVSLDNLGNVISGISATQVKTISSRSIPENSITAKINSIKTDFGADQTEILSVTFDDQSSNEVCISSSSNLSKSNIVHRDLAARNILLTSECVKSPRDSASGQATGKRNGSGCPVVTDTLSKYSPPDGKIVPTEECDDKNVDELDGVGVSFIDEIKDFKNLSSFGFTSPNSIAQKNTSFDTVNNLNIDSKVAIIKTDSSSKLAYFSNVSIENCPNLEIAIDEPGVHRSCNLAKVVYESAVVTPRETSSGQASGKTTKPSCDSSNLRHCTCDSGSYISGRTCTCPTGYYVNSSTKEYVGNDQDCDDVGESVEAKSAKPSINLITTSASLTSEIYKKYQSKAKTSEMKIVLNFSDGSSLNVVYEVKPISYTVTYDQNAEPVEIAKFEMVKVKQKQWLPANF